MPNGDDISDLPQAVAETAQPSEGDTLPVAFQVFAATLRPAPVRDAQGKVVGLLHGQPDEVWLKFIRRHHGNEKHTMTGWAALIDIYRKQPAHPAGMVG